MHAEYLSAKRFLRDFRSKFLPGAFAVFLLTLVLCVHSAHACPLVDGLVDFNCDGISKIGITGDSIVRGIGDLRFKNDGSYGKRLARSYFKHSKVLRAGFPGFTTLQLFSILKRKLESHGGNEVKKALLDADIVIVDVGRNDYFTTEYAEMPGLTARNIKRIVEYLRIKLGSSGHTAPLMVVAALTPTTRGFQRPFIDEVNSILHLYTSSTLPVRLAFDTLNPDLISYDGIHPGSEGYAAMAEIAAMYIAGDAQDQMKASRPDDDKDGIYDQFERKKFHTKKAVADTDGDGLLDGEEVFTQKTDPRVADTDGDSFADGAEVIGGSDPLDPESTPAAVD